jgi:hypothetical protein
VDSKRFCGGLDVRSRRGSTAGKLNARTQSAGGRVASFGYPITAKPARAQAAHERGRSPDARNGECPSLGRLFSLAFPKTPSLSAANAASRERAPVRQRNGDHVARVDAEDAKASRASRDPSCELLPHDRFVSANKRDLRRPATGEEVRDSSHGNLRHAANSTARAQTCQTTVASWWIGSLGPDADKNLFRNDPGSEERTLPREQVSAPRANSVGAIRRRSRSSLAGGRHVRAHVRGRREAGGSRRCA